MNDATAEAAVTTLAMLRESSRAVISREEAAAILEVDPRTLTTAIDDGTIHAIRVGRRLVIPRETFLALFDSPALEDQ